MTLLYIAKEAPFGATETFVIEEALAHIRAGEKLIMCPVRPGRVRHEQAEQIVPFTIVAPLFSFKIFVGCLSAFVRQPILSARVLLSLLSCRPKLAVKNLAVFPKGAWLSEQVRRLKIAHIHAHWIAVPASMGYVASRLSGIPMSITAHRYDISQANLLNLKCRHAHFVRAIDLRGAAELESAVRTDLSFRANVLHMGVRYTERAPLRLSGDGVTQIVTAARFVPKKAHLIAVEAAARLRDSGHRFKWTFFGDGPLEGKIRERIERLKLASVVSLGGVISNNRLIELLRERKFDFAVLPSVNAKDSDREGIPVFLMEALMAGVPSIATDNGGITELTGHDGALIIPEGDSIALASALEEMISNPTRRESYAKCGHRRVKLEFDVDVNAEKLRGLFYGT